jgi:hypothetical protein
MIRFHGGVKAQHQLNSYVFRRRLFAAAARGSKAPKHSVAASVNVRPIKITAGGKFGRVKGRLLDMIPAWGSGDKHILLFRQEKFAALAAVKTANYDGSITLCL